MMSHRQQSVTPLMKPGASARDSLRLERIADAIAGMSTTWETL